MSTYFKNLVNIIKGRQKEILLFFLLFLISSISFALGYLMNRQNDRAPIIIEKRTGK